MAGKGSYLLRGDILFPERTSRGSISVIDGVVDHFTPDDLEGPEGGATLIEGLIIPGLLDMHTHLGDHDARGDLPASMRDAFFPGGVKHRFLERSDRSSLVRSIRSSISELLPGVSVVLDFREGGIEGINALEEAAEGYGIRIMGFGRPQGTETAEELLERASGLGMPSLDSILPGMREASRRAEKPFALHASELFREDVSRILDLDPDLVVHMVSGTKDDWKALSEEKVPVAVCPRANRCFGLDADIKGMLEEGLMVCLGTDNAMSMRQDMFREMECAWSLLHGSGMGGTEASRTVLDMASGRSVSGSEALRMLDAVPHWGEGDWITPGHRVPLQVVKGPSAAHTRDPWSYVVRFCSQGDVLFGN